MLSKRTLIFMSLLAVAFMGFSLLIKLTSLRGIGITFDGAHYIAAARYFLDNSLTHSAQSMMSFEFFRVHWLPFYPLLLSLWSRAVDLDPVEAARWLQATLFACYIICVGVLIERYTRSVLITIAGAIAACLSPRILPYYASVLSEPTFIFFLLLWLIFFMGFLENPKRYSLFILCLLAVMCASLTRFSTIALVVASIIGIAVFLKVSIKTKFIYTVLFAGVGLLPLFVWGEMNRHAVGMTGDKIFAFHPLPLSGYNILTRFSFFERGAAFPGRFSGIIVFIILILGLIIWEKRDRGAIAGIPDKVMVFMSMLLITCLSYYSGVVLTLTFFDPTALLDRYLLPIRVLGLLLVFTSLNVLLSITKARFLSAIFMIVFFVSAGWASLIHVTNLSVQMYFMGDGYNSSRWQNSAIIEEVKEIPQSKVLYTNDSAAIYMLTKRESYQLLSESVEKNIGYKLLLNPLIIFKSMRDDLKARKGLLVYFNSKPDFCEYPKKCFPTVDELKHEFQLKLVLRTSDGEIYEWDEN